MAQTIVRVMRSGVFMVERADSREFVGMPSAGACFTWVEVIEWLARWVGFSGRVVVRRERLMIRSRRWSGPASAWEVKALLGLREGQALPRDGMAERLIDGVRVYVAPLLARGRKGRDFQGLRVMAICECGKHVAVGRLAQHRCKGVM